MAILIAVPSGAVLPLAELDVSRMLHGTLVSALGTGDVFQLIASDDAVDHVNVESVNGNGTLRWKKFTSLVSLTGFPSYEVYVDPLGDDDNDGSASSPKLTIHAAAQSAIEQGGGTVFFNDNSVVGGPIEDQGLWLRADGIEVPGFLDMSSARLRIVGSGTASGNFIFESPGAARIVGGGTEDFTNPVIWVVGSEVPVEFIGIKNVQVPSGQGHASPFRLGWDYARRPNFTREALTVTNASRASGETVYSVDLSTATPWTIESADRDIDDNVTLVLTRPATVAMSPWVGGSIIRVDTGGDTDFPDVDAVVTNQSDVLNLSPSTTQITVNYTQAGATIAKSLSGTVVSHGCAVGDYITAEFENAEFVTCPQMSVTAVTVDTVTVFDPYGYGPRSATVSADPSGTITKQLRGRMVSSGVNIARCSIIGIVGGASDAFYASPALDMGGTSANDIRINQTYITGGNAWDWTGTPDNYDPNRTQVAILADPGAHTLSGASFQAYDCQSQAGHVIFNPRDTEGHVYIDQWLQDSASNALPTIVLGEGTHFASVYLHRIGQADAATSAITVARGYDGLKVKIGDVYSSNPIPVANLSPITGPTNIRAGLWSDAGAPSPWALGWQTQWSGGLSTPHVNVNRALGPVQARLANLFPLVADWQNFEAFPAGITVTENDGEAPDESNTATKIVFANSGTQGFFIGDVPFGTWAVGDGVAIGLWVKSPGAAEMIVASNISDATVFTGGNTTIRFGRLLRSEGWQWITAAARVTEVNGAFAGRVILQFVAPEGSTYIWGQTLLYSPAGEMNDDEFFEVAGNLKHQPLYLQPGMSGTMEETKFIAHGGLGVKTDLVVVETPGTADRTLIIYDEQGNPLIKLHGEAP